MTARLGILIGGSLLFWLIALALGSSLASGLGIGGELLPYSGIALAICLVPAVATFLATEILVRRRPDLLGIAFLAGTLLRMGIVLTLAVTLSRLEFFQRWNGWFAWVVVFYLLVLALETTLLVSGRNSTSAE